MLVLSRRVNETILFPGLGITVRVVRLRGAVIRLGIDAPPEVKFVRGEPVASAVPVAVTTGPSHD
jgi:carbon storage regulator CsrA